MNISYLVYLRKRTAQRERDDTEERRDGGVR
jgi:hypothetical protein